jgi:hypothetical protein
MTTLPTREELLAEIDRLVRVEKAARAVCVVARSLPIILPPPLVSQLMILSEAIDRRRPLPPEWNEEDWQ